MGGIIGRLFREFAVTLGDRHRRLGGALADADGDDVRAPPASPHARRTTGRVARASERGVRLDGRASTTAASRWVLDHQRADAGWSPSATVALTVVLAVVVPKGFFPQQDTGLILGSPRRRPTSRSARMMERQQRASPTSCAPIPTSPRVASFIGADGTNPTLNSGRLRSRSSRATQRNADAQRDHRAPAAASSPQVERHHRSTCRPVQDLQIDSRVSRTQYQYTLEDADPTELREWAPQVLEPPARSCPSCATSPATSRRGGAAADADHRSRHAPRASASRRRPSTTRSTTPSGSGRSRPSSPSSTCTA